ncbi:MAG: NUDIX domain-containing protein [Spirochaetales bacterium]
MALLPSTANPFGGRIIDHVELDPSWDREIFARMLRESIDAWTADRVKVVWLQLSPEQVELVPPAIQAGFVYHHATEGWVQLTKTLVEGSYIPPFATHYIGAGGVVIDDYRRLLVIQERHHTRPHLKLPGGALHPGEHIADAVMREVKEETGIETRFVSLVCFRHWHGYRYHKSDIYFVTRLEPLSLEIVPDPSEIAMCRWMNIDEYLLSEHTHAFNRRIVRAALDAERGRGELVPDVIEGYGSRETHEIFMPGGR